MRGTVRILIILIVSMPAVCKGPETRALPAAVSGNGREVHLDGKEHTSRGAAAHQWIVAGSVIVDLHNDALTQVYEAEDLSIFFGNELECSLPRLEQGGLKAAFFAVWVPDEQKPGFCNDLIEIFFDLLGRSQDRIAFASSISDLEKNRAEQKISAFLAIEGGQAIGGDLDLLDEFYARGVRYMTLTWNQSNLIADAAKDPNKPHGGLSPFGRRVVKRMNELGMIVDVSHASDQTVDQVLQLSSRPVIASHSNCYSVRPHFRNLKDRHVRGICDRGGVIGVNFHGTFLVKGRPARTSDVADHIDRIVELGGIGCAALGSDFDGRIKPPRGLKHMGQLENLTAELIDRGYREDDIKKIYGKNFLRVLEEAETR